MKKYEMILERKQLIDDFNARIETLHYEYKSKLSEEKSKFNSLLRDKIKQNKQLKRAKKGILYWENKYELCIIDRDLLSEANENLRTHNRELKEDIADIFSYNIKFNANDGMIATDANDNIIVVARKHE